MKKFVIKTPAKINFGLNVIRKREDGYHDIETIFYPVKLYDTLIITTSSSYSFNTNSQQLNDEGNNLISQGVKLLEEYCGRNFNIDIFLEKNIPMGAGMGGGSSDAAAILKGLNELYELGISNEDLKNLAFKIGSDAPFFINPSPCFAESRGEVLHDINFKIPYPLLIVNPGIHSSTKSAYSKIKPAKPVKNLLQIVSGQNDIKDYKDLIFNDFEQVIFSEFDQLCEIKGRMYSLGAMFALMTGSGSSFFGIFPDNESVKKAEEYFRGLNYFTFIEYPLPG